LECFCCPSFWSEDLSRFLMSVWSACVCVYVCCICCVRASSVCIPCRILPFCTLSLTATLGHSSSLSLLIQWQGANEDIIHNVV
jgi:hypothetical protein